LNSAGDICIIYASFSSPSVSSSGILPLQNTTSKLVLIEERELAVHTGREPQLRSREMVRFKRTTFSSATNAFMENGS
jgi:hypothetical protein